MVTARHAMMAVLRGRLDEASRRTREVVEAARGPGCPTPTRSRARWPVRWPPSAAPSRAEQGSSPARLGQAAAGHLSRRSRSGSWLCSAAPPRPAPISTGCSAARLAASGRRWLGVMADLSVVAASVGNTDAAARLADALTPYRGRLVVWGGANSTWGPVSHYVGLLAAAQGQAGRGPHFEEAIELEEQIGALPYLAHSLDGLASALTARAAAGRRTGGGVTPTRPRDRGAVGPDRAAGAVSPGARRVDAGPGRRGLGADSRWRARPVAGRPRPALPARLLAAPGQDILALDLAAGGAGLAAARRAGAGRRRAGCLPAAARRLPPLDAADRAGDRRRRSGSGRAAGADEPS